MAANGLRRWLVVVWTFLVLAGAPAAWGQSDTITVTLLGTGTPDPRIDRFGPSTLVEAGGKKLVFDVGRGATIRLQQIGVSIGRLSGVFLTHFHSDHTNGIPDLWLTGWLPPHGARQSPLRMWGPAGTRELMHFLEKAYRADRVIRMADEKLPPRGIATEVTEFSRDSVVFDEDGVTVSAFRVDHGQYVVPAYGYKVAFGKRSVVISGDTRYCENVIVHARGADLLLHEVAMAAGDIRSLPHIRRILDHHTSPADAGRVFAQARPGLAVFTHLALLGGPGGRRPSVQDVMTETRETYGGPLEIGEDLMRIVVGETIRVDRFDPAKQGY
ncbi:MAG: MBL fold metallo-hydrolase [Acidobacteriota bacterium]